MVRYSLIACLLSACALPAVAAETAADYGKASAVLKKYCVGCHNLKDKEGELSLESYEDLIKGGENGPVVVAGKPDASKMILVLTGKAEPTMPPEDNERPTADEIAVLASWIKAGAKAGSPGPPAVAAATTPHIKPHKNVHEAISAMAWSPNGKLLAIARFNNVDYIAQSDQSLRHRLTGQKGRINALSFSKDGLKLAVAAGEAGIAGQARIWDLTDGVVLREIKGHDDSIYAAVVSPDGSRLATSSYDQQIRMWDVKTGEPLKLLAGHNDAVYDIAFRPDGKVLASASGDRTVKLWDPVSGQRLDTFGQPLKEVYTLAFSPDGKFLAAGGADSRIRVWQISGDAKENTNPILYSRFAHEGAVIKLAYTPDGNTLISSGEDRTVKLWNASNVTERMVLEPQSDWAAALSVHPDGKSLAVGRLDGSFARYDLQTGKRMLPMRPNVASLTMRGIRQGSTSRIKLKGLNLFDVTEVQTSDPKLKTQIVPDSAHYNEIEVDVTAAADLARGVYKIWPVSSGGRSEKLAVEVDNLPQGIEREPNNDLAAATPVTLPQTVWGQFNVVGDVDHFTFDAKAGQTVVCEMLAQELGAVVDPILELFDEAGRPVAGTTERLKAVDPVSAFKISADGKYTLRVRDLQLAGGSAQFYRISMGTFSYATGFFPLSVPANKDATVELVGFNLPPGSKVTIPAAKPGRTDVPLEGKVDRARQAFKIRVGQFSEFVESEPNDQPSAATPVAVPCTVGGRIWRAGSDSESARSQSAGSDSVDSDLFRFDAKRGQKWVIETEAAQRGSPLDTLIDVLHADGKPVERLVLQAVRDSNITLRGIETDNGGARLLNWEEMEPNQYLYMNGEVVRLFRVPRGPDSEYDFYPTLAGGRRAYFDTTSTSHAVEEACYIVEPLPAGSRPSFTGLPVFRLNYVNDDEGQRRLGTDSQLTFTAPADGTYLVRVRDARGQGGARHSYRLTIRPPQPDFNSRLTTANITVSPGNGRGFGVEIDRFDGFEGPVRVDISDVPPGFHVTTPLVVEEGQIVARGLLYADADAPAPTAETASKTKLRATAMIDGKEIVKTLDGLGKIQLGPKPKLLVRMEPAEITIAPGGRATATLKLVRNGNKDVVSFMVPNLPHGVIVDNIGLVGVLMLPNESERQIFLSAAPYVAETDRPAFAQTINPDGDASPPVMIHIRKPAGLAQAK